jgi:hypothetical protein
MQQLICAWCLKEMRSGPAPASHGICTECATEQFPERPHFEEEDAPMEKETVTVLPADLTAALDMMESFSATGNELIAARRYIELLFARHLPVTPPHFICEECGTDLGEYHRDGGEPDCPRCMEEAHRQQNEMQDAYGEDDASQPMQDDGMTPLHDKRDLDSDLCEDR